MLDTTIGLCYNNKVFIRRHILILLAVALEEELSLDNVPKDMEITYTGVGKINATFALTKTLCQPWPYKPTEVINFGTAGAVKKGVKGLVEVDTIIQRDMLATPLEPRGITPYAEPSGIDHAIMLHSNTDITLGTGDSFVSEHDPWFEYANIDIVDMEGYALAVVCAKMGIKFRCFKYISDNADGNAEFDWKSSLNIAKNSFIERMNQENNLKT